MSVNDSWMPLYLGDYMADTMHLNATQHGAYLLLLMHYWRNGPLPDDDTLLAAIARCDARMWKLVGPVIRRFFRSDGEELHQKRMDQERNKWSAISDKRREAGRAGAEAKWKSNGSHPPPNPNASGLGNADIQPVDNSGGMANAIGDPVDKYGNRIASAIDLPEKKWQMPPVCHRFATTPVPSKNFNSLSFKEVVPPPVREEAPSVAEIGTARRRDAVALSSAGEVGGVVLSLSSTLDRIAFAPGRSRVRSVAEQIAEATPKPTIKPSHLPPEQLAIERAKLARKVFA